MRRVKKWPDVTSMILSWSNFLHSATGGRTGTETEAEGGNWKACKGQARGQTAPPGEASCFVKGPLGGSKEREVGSPGRLPQGALECALPPSLPREPRRLGRDLYCCGCQRPGLIVLDKDWWKKLTNLPTTIQLNKWRLPNLNPGQSSSLVPPGDLGSHLVCFS